MASSLTSFDDHGYFFQWDARNPNPLTQLNCVLPTVRSLEEQMCRSINLVQASSADDSDISGGRHFMNIQAGKETDYQDKFSKGKGLSLNLSSYIPQDGLMPSFHYRQTDPQANIEGSSYVVGRESSREVQSSGFKQNQDDYSFNRGDALDHAYSSTMSKHHIGLTSNELASFTSSNQNSKYLKPVQNLLEEIVSVNKAVGFDLSKLRTNRIHSMATKAGKSSITGTRNMFCNNEHPSTEKHDIQIRITKLVALLDEVDTSYEQYCHQMEEVESSFDVVAGSGAAKSYTALALQAMSTHFGTLRDAIITQINVARRNLSEDFPRIQGGLSQLKLFDQNARQKRAALQQLGVIQIQQTWRPLRGLPENSVAVLCAWLFEHFLHPYPTDFEKLMLASQTGLTRNQVSNWFINARVRLWKPMIEEMYREEFAEASKDSDDPSNAHQ